MPDAVRQDRRRLADVDVLRTAAERARALVVDDADARRVVRRLRRGAQRRRDLRPRVPVAVLDVAVDDRAVLRHVRDRDVRADRSVHLVVVGERSRVRLRGRLHRRVEARRSSRSGPRYAPAPCRPRPARASTSRGCRCRRSPADRTTAPSAARRPGSRRTRSCATTPTTLPTCTICTSLTFLIELSSIFTGTGFVPSPYAPWPRGRMIRPCHMFGIRTLTA